MERLTKLPVGLLVQDKDMNGYIILARNDEDTLLYTGVDQMRWFVAWNLLTDDRYDPEELEKAVSAGRVDGYDPPFVSWEQERYFDDGEEAMRFMQDRHMKHTGKRMCHHAGHLPCQYYEECRKGTNCTRCNARLIWENPHIPGHFHESSNIAADGWDICIDCMGEHCVSTNCFGCSLGEYPECQFLSMKKLLMEEKTDNEEGELDEDS